jgi:hypothetical protein
MGFGRVQDPGEHVRVADLPIFELEDLEQIEAPQEALQLLELGAVDDEVVQGLVIGLEGGCVGHQAAVE